jgi:hypothetical protein
LITRKIKLKLHLYSKVKKQGIILIRLIHTGYIDVGGHFELLEKDQGNYHKINDLKILNTKYNKI